MILRFKLKAMTLALLGLSCASQAQVTTTVSNMAPVADSYTESVSVWNNYGKIVYMRVNTGRDGLMRFDLTGLSDKEVISAVLKVTPVAAFPVPLDVYSMLDNGWTEYNVCYNNRPSTVVASLGQLNGSTGAQTSLDITSAVRQFQGQNLTLKLSSANTDKLGYLNTKESAQAPVLVLTTKPRSLALIPSADNFADPAAPTTTAYTSTQLQVDGQPGADSFMKFDLSALSGKTPLSALLRIKPDQVPGGPVNVRLLQYADTNVNALTYNTQPPLVPDVVASQGSLSSTGWLEFDLTNVVKATGLNMLALELDGNSGQALTFPSMEASQNGPQLLVYYSKAATPPPPLVSPPPLKVGVNIDGTSYYSMEVPLVDLMKQGHTWYTGCNPYSDSYCSVFKPGGGSFDTLEQSLLNVDGNGWVKTLPAPADGATTHVNYTSVSTIIPSSLSPQWPTGRFTVLYEGEGSIAYRFSNGTLTKNTALSAPGKDVLDVSLGAGKGAGLSMMITINKTDPNHTGNYIRNMHVFPPGGVCSDDATMYCRTDVAGASCNPGATCQDFATVYQSKPFDPRFLANIKRFDTFRFMGYQNTVDALNEVNWSDRTQSDNYTWQRAGYHLNTYESVVALGNTLNRNLWLNVPYKATDDYILQMANLVHSQLNSTSKVYLEYGNEIWNTLFTGGTYAEAQGVARWPLSNATAYEKRLQWQGLRTAQMCDIWKKAWGSDANRLICVAGVQPGNVWSAALVLDCPLYVNESANAPCYSKIDAVAVAPYFAGAIGQYNHATDLATWTQDSDGGLNRLFTEINSGGQFSDSPAGGSLASAQRALALTVGAAKDRGLMTVNYEGGQSLVAQGSAASNAAVVALFSNANRDARMGTAYSQYLSMLKSSGVSLFNQWTSVGSFSVFGNWGLLEWRDQGHSAKYDAVINFLGTLGQ